MVGITINQYQVDRATYHNERQGLAAQCKARAGGGAWAPGSRRRRAAGVC